MDSVNLFFTSKFNSDSVSHQDESFRGWKNKYSISVAKNFLAVNNVGATISNKSVVWKNVSSWGIQLDSLVIKDEILIHMKPKVHGDIAFGIFDISKLIDDVDDNNNSNAVVERLRMVSSISSSISVNGKKISVGCDFPGAILVSMNVVLRFLVGLDTFDQAVEKYPMLIVLVKGEGEINFLSKKSLSYALSEELSAIGEKYGKVYIRGDQDATMFRGTSKKVYSFSLKGESYRKDDNDNRSYRKDDNDNGRYRKKDMKNGSDKHNGIKVYTEWDDPPNGENRRTSSNTSHNNRHNGRKNTTFDDFFEELENGTNSTTTERQKVKIGVEDLLKRI